MSGTVQTRHLVADAVVSLLVDAGVDHAFGIPGLHTLALYGALADEPRIRHVTCRHESAATFAADGFARVSGGIGLVLATTGPGTFNTIGALSEADLDGSPVLVVAGQIPARLVGGGKGVLHETDDQASAFAPVCDIIERPRTAREVVMSMARALDGLRRPGARPAYVELPLDLLDEDAPEGDQRRTEHGPRGADAIAMARATALLASARRPVVPWPAAVSSVNAPRTPWSPSPSVWTLPSSIRCLGGSDPVGHPLDAGPLVPARGGAADLLATADVVLVCGDRLDDQTTAGWTLRLGDALVHLVDRPEHLDRGYVATVGICGSVGRSLTELVDALQGSGPATPPGDGPVRAARTRDALRASVIGEPARMLEVFGRIRDRVPRETIVVSDAATIDSWTAFFWPASRPGSFLFPWGSAALGFALPAAIGASLAAPDTPVLAVCGDGGFLFTMAELGTAVQVGANVTLLVHDDGGYGSIAAYQRRRGAPEHGTALGHVDLAQVAVAHGIRAARVDDLALLPSAIEHAVAESGPSFIHLTAPVTQPW